jgi:peroxiredoxin
MALQTGHPAPDFALYSDEKHLTRLSDFKGRPVVLLFFPLAFTGTCTRELCQTRDDIGRYEDLNAVVLAISTDSPQTLARYKQDHGFNFTLLSDYNKEVINTYDVIYPEFSLGMRGVAKRAVFVIDADGILRHSEVLENAGELPDLAAAQAALRQLATA